MEDIQNNISTEFSQHIALCFCVRNCGIYLENIFKNIQLLVDNNDYKISCVFVYDNCRDNTGDLLKEYKQKSKHDVHIKDLINENRLRTVRIANARNACLDIVYNTLDNVSYHIMIDSDNVNTHVWNIDTINKYISNYDNDKWDCMTFNRNNYYDIWALLIDDFKHHCWGFGRNHRRVIPIMRDYVINKINNSSENSIECLSAFNGFAIYKTVRFKDLHYDGEYNNMKSFITDDERNATIQLFKNIYNVRNINIDNNYPECCEHIFYHLSARHKNNCVIKISKLMV